MRTVIFTLLIGTIIAVACASPAPNKFQRLQALLKEVQEEKQVQLMDNGDDDDNDDVEKALTNLIQKEMAMIQDDDLADGQCVFCRPCRRVHILQTIAKMQDDDNDKLADTQCVFCRPCAMALLNLIQQKMAKMQDDGNDQVADAQILHTIFKIGKKFF